LPRLLRVVRRATLLLINDQSLGSILVIKATH
jgi:hypothetical protein